MRTVSECLVMAVEMERISDSSPDAEMAAEYEALAVYWRGLARMAAGQDGITQAEAVLDKWLRQPAVH